MSLHVSDELLSAELDGALSPGEAAEVASHVAQCAGCAHRRELMRATAGAVATLPTDDVPGALDLSFLPRRSPGFSPVRVAPRRWRPPLWVAPVLAAAAVLLVAVSVAPGMLHGRGAATTASSGSAGLAGPGSAADKSQFQPIPELTPTARAGGAPEAGTASVQAGASHTYADAGGLVVELHPSATQAGAGQPVSLTLQVRAGQSVALRALSLDVRQGTGVSSIASSSAPGLAAGQQAALSTTWTAGQVGGAIQPGDYVLEGRATLTDGRVFSVEVTIRVS